MFLVVTRVRMRRDNYDQEFILKIKSVYIGYGDQAFKINNNERENISYHNYKLKPLATFLQFKRAGKKDNFLVFTVCKKNILKLAIGNQSCPGYPCSRLKISVQSQEHYCGSPEFPNQNVRQIGPGVY